MKSTPSRQAAQGVPARVAFQVQFGGGPKGRPRVRREAPIPASRTRASTGITVMPTPKPVEKVSFGRLPKITQLLVLGHHFENLVREGRVKDYAEIARLTGLSRARVTQVVNLTLLAPTIQERILGTGIPVDNALPVERRLRSLTSEVLW